MFHTIVSIKNDGHYFCRAGGNRPDGLNEPVTVIYQSVESKNEFSGCWYNHELLLPFVQERVPYGSETPGSRTHDMGIYDA